MYLTHFLFRENEPDTSEKKLIYIVNCCEVMFLRRKKHTQFYRRLILYVRMYDLSWVYIMLEIYRGVDVSYMLTD